MFSIFPCKLSLYIIFNINPMHTIRILQIGMGPLGVKIAKMIHQRSGVETVAAVDISADLNGKDLGFLHGTVPSGIAISNDLKKEAARAQADIVVLTTVSDMQRITAQLETILQLGLPVVSTCEELSHPWEEAPEAASKIDALAKANGVAVLGTGVNPGFLMDAFPIFLTAVCQHVEHVRINRYQDAQYRRVPFQKKIGAGLTLEQFDQKKKEGTLRHVGLTESMQMFAKRMGWQLTKTEDIIAPIVAEKIIKTNAMTIVAGNATGVEQIGRGYVGDELKIELHFRAAVGEPESFDEIKISGTPDLHSRIQGGVNGDIATGAIVINSIPRVLEASPGLKTMMEIHPVSFFL